VRGRAAVVALSHLALAMLAHERPLPALRGVPPLSFATRSAQHVRRGPLPDARPAVVERAHAALVRTLARARLPIVRPHAPEELLAFGSGGGSGNGSSEGGINDSAAEDELDLPDMAIALNLASTERLRVPRALLVASDGGGGHDDGFHAHDHDQDHDQDPDGLHAMVAPVLAAPEQTRSSFAALPRALLARVPPLADADAVLRDLLLAPLPPVLPPSFVDARFFGGRGGVGGASGAHRSGDADADLVVSATSKAILDRWNFDSAF
jgi:hypothetical protein